jgi:hypothetical protein
MPSVRARPHAGARARKEACGRPLGRAAPQPKAALESALRDRDGGAGAVLNIHRNYADDELTKEVSVW